jgi:two-component system CheB/CheR fusion protein
VNDHTAAVHLYRISQEAITNAARHAGAAGIWVSLRDVDREIVVTVEDDGQGISSDSATSTGLGLRLMLYRARMIGASLTIGRRDSNPAAPRPGTIVRCVYRNVLDNKEPRDGAPTPNDPKHTKPGEAKRVADSVGG